MLHRACLLLLALSLAACPASEAAAAARVVASVLPVHALVAGVMDGIGEPRLLVPPGTSPHGHQMRPSEAAALREADLVIWVGEPLEAFLAKPILTLAAEAQILELLEAPGVTLLPAREGGVRRPDAPEHDHGSIDPHLWLDPVNARAMTAAIAAALVTIDPANGAAYSANAAELEGGLDALTGELHETLAPIRETPFIVFHDAFQYLERAFDLNAVGSLTTSPDRPASARRVATLRKAIVEHRAVCVFAEPQTPSGLIAPLVEGTDVGIGELDAEGGPGIAPGPEAYHTLMRAIARALVDCLGRSG